jgi:hypothetical protein
MVLLQQTLTPHPDMPTKSDKTGRTDIPNPDTGVPRFSCREVQSRWPFGEGGSSVGHCATRDFKLISEIEKSYERL